MKPKLFYIFTERLPTEEAGGQQVIKMCEAFSDAGCNVRLLASRRKTHIKDDPFSYYGAKNNFEIVKIFCIDTASWDKYLGRPSFWIRQVTFAMGLIFYIAFKNYDILYTRDKFTALFLALFGKKFFLEVHTVPPRMFLPFYRRAHGMITITSQLKSILTKYELGKDKIFVAPDGVDMEKFRIRATQAECRYRLNLPPDKKIVLYTGHLREWKGAHELARASKYLTNEAVIYFIGGRPEEIKSFRSVNASRSIEVVGYRPPSEIPVWLRAADVLVLPNSAKYDSSKYWTSPMKLFEYMASGKPIVASDLPSLREVLDEGNSILVKPDDGEVLARGIKKLLYDNVLADRISKKALGDVESHTWYKRARAILEFIRA